MAQLKLFHDNLRPRLRKLNKNHFADIHEQKDKAKQCLEDIQKQMQADPNNIALH